MRSSRAIALRMLALCGLGLALSSAPGPSFSQDASGPNANIDGRPERELLQLANRDRVEKGLPPLKWDNHLARAAQQHASRMAQEGKIAHQFPTGPGLESRVAQAGGRFNTIAENVAMGPNAERIHQEWMRSAPHRANLLDRHLDTVGIAVAAQQGTLYAVEDFAVNGAGVAGLSVAQQENMLGNELRSRGLRVETNDVDAARRTCALDNGYVGGNEPSFVVHYYTMDPQRLPDMLERKIKGSDFRSAAVGACPAGGNAEPTQYRIAVMLYE